MNVVKTLLLESFRVIEIPIRYVQNLRKKISYHLPIYRSSLLLHRILYSMRLQLAHTGTDDIVSISVQYLSTSTSFVLRAIFLNRNRRKLTSTHTSNFFSKRLSAQQKFFDQNFEKKKKKNKTQFNNGRIHANNAYPRLRSSTSINASTSTCILSVASLKIEVPSWKNNSPRFHGLFNYDPRAYRVVCTRRLPDRTTATRPQLLPSSST